MLRFDEIRLDARGFRELPDGSIKVTGQLTRAGIFTYFQDGKARREYRPADEVFRADALETFAGVPVTVKHPRGRLVSSQTWKDDAVGHMGDSIRKDGDVAIGDLYIRDAATVAEVKAGRLKGLSLGYRVQYDPTPGTTPEGERYDGVQRNIRGNHVALLPSNIPARGGPECVLRLDSAGDEIDPSNDAREDAGVKSERMTPEQIAALQAELTQARADAAEVPALRASLKTALAQPAALPQDRIDALVSERADVLALAGKHGIKTADKDGKALTNLAIKRAVVAKTSPAVADRVDSFGDETVNALLTVEAAKPHPSLKAVVDVATVPVVEGARADADADKLPTMAELRKKSDENLRNAWKGN